MHDSFFVVSDSRVYLLEYGRILDDAHAQELLRSPVLVKDVVRVLPELLHIGADEHLTELDKVTVILIVDLDDTPGVGTTTNFTTVWGRNNLVRTNNSERNLAGNLFSLGQRFLVLVLVSGCLEDVNLVEGNICEKLAKTQWAGHKVGMRRTYSGLEIGNLLISHSIRFGDHRNEVNARVQTRHEFNINRSKASRAINTHASNLCDANLRVTCWLNEVEASMDTIVDDFLTIDLVLVFQELVKSRLNVLEDWSPTRGVSQKKEVVRGGIEREPLIVVHKIPETRGIHDRQAEANAVLLNICNIVIQLPYRTRVARPEDKPALILSMATVLGFSALGGRGSFGW